MVSERAWGTTAATKLPGELPPQPSSCWDNRAQTSSHTRGKYSTGALSRCLLPLLLALTCLLPLQGLQCSPTCPSAAEPASKGSAAKLSTLTQVSSLPRTARKSFQSCPSHSTCSAPLLPQSRYLFLCPVLHPVPFCACLHTSFSPALYSSRLSSFVQLRLSSPDAQIPP